MQPIEARYLLLTLVPHHVDESGEVWVDRLWHRDLVAHFRYLKHIVLAAPTSRLKSARADDLVRLSVPSDVTLTLAPLPMSSSTREAIASLPALTRALWRAIGQSDVVHSGVAGWPMPVGWIANPIAMMRGRTLLVVVESAPWRTSGAAHERPRDRARELVSEALARFFVRRADVKLFTHPSYRRSLAPEHASGCHVTPAAWIDATDIATAAQASASWDDKRARGVRLLFAARLVPEKGVDVLLDALRELDARGVSVAIDVMGEGPRREACADAARRLRHVSLRLLAPQPYGPRFFEHVRASHAVLAPNLGDEQPRIVFDAYAQAVPVIGFDTDGLRPHVKDGETGWLIPRDGLSKAIERASASPRELERMGLAALREAPRFTHRAMHDARWRILERALGARGFRGGTAALRPSAEADGMP
jgi:glycosyltransferase involved in cell wall biosynthesis